MYIRDSFPRPAIPYLETELFEAREKKKAWLLIVFVGKAKRGRRLDKRGLCDFMEAFGVGWDGEKKNLWKARERGEA